MENFSKLRGEIPNFDEIICTNGTINVEGNSRYGDEFLIYKE
ncbi:hypothetical protein [Lysinibacillus sp. FJAT-14222]|nr:hypothetical protein [Lysinibacillus sp. FJAT-14222]